MQTQSFNAVVLAPSPFDGDPRHETWSQFLSTRGFNVLRIEVLDEGRPSTVARGAQFNGRVLTLFSNERPRRAERGLWPLVSRLPSQSLLGKYLKSRLFRQIAASSLPVFGNACPGIVIANDLAGALIALSIWGESTAQVVYDAQEIFTDSYDMLDGPRLTQSERQAWIDLETEVCQRVARVVTVSPGLAALYDERHTVKALVVPNYSSVNMHVDSAVHNSDGPVRFVFIGRADPHRGLEELVARWDIPQDVATLDMIVAHSPMRERLVRRSLIQPRKFTGPVFRDPVMPSEMISTLSTYEVGVLPYNYHYPYSHASPNKFGEYLAAGLAVVANDQPFVSSVIADHGIGMTFRWNDELSFEAVVRDVSERSLLEQIRANVITARREHLNWESFVDSPSLRILEEETSQGLLDLDTNHMTQAARRWKSILWSTRHLMLKLARRSSSLWARLRRLAR